MLGKYKVFSDFALIVKTRNPSYNGSKTILHTTLDRLHPKAESIAPPGTEVVGWEHHRRHLLLPALQARSMENIYNDHRTYKNSPTSEKYSRKNKFF